MEYLIRSLRMGITLENRTKGVDIGFVVVD